MTAILIVDDEPNIRDLLARWLNGSEYVTSQAPDAESAFEMMTAKPADVVLCDIEMPGKGGLWLIPTLREHFPTAAVVLITGVDSVPPAISLQGGVVQYLTKPFTRERVLAAVAEAAQWHRSTHMDGASQTASPDSVAEWLERGPGRKA